MLNAQPHVMTELEEAQKILCARYGSAYTPTAADHILGLSKNFTLGVMPMHGLRYPPRETTSGWYLWRGDYSEEDDFFDPVHAKHVHELQIAKFLALAPGWRFLCDEDYEDVWFDPSLLET